MLVLHVSSLELIATLMTATRSAPLLSLSPAYLQCFSCLSLLTCYDILQTYRKIKLKILTQRRRFVCKNICMWSGLRIFNELLSSIQSYEKIFSKQDNVVTNTQSVQCHHVFDTAYVAPALRGHVTPLTMLSRLSVNCLTSSLRPTRYRHACSRSTWTCFHHF